MVPFANSDFWLRTSAEFHALAETTDCGRGKIKMRKGVPAMLESVNPHPGAADTRVCDHDRRETGKPILAEAYGPDDKLLKDLKLAA